MRARVSAGPSASVSARQALAVLHPVFALTGIVHAISGPLMPSLAPAFHLNDSESGLLFLLYFGGTSLGALISRRDYARTMALGFLVLAAGCLGVALIARTFLFPIFLLLGIGAGIPMSCVSLYAGQRFAPRCAPALTFLNLTWSAGALAAPLFAARILVAHSYREAYLLLALAAVLASLACLLFLRDVPEPSLPPQVNPGLSNLRLICLFAFIAFLEIGVENTSAAWLSTYSLRSARGSAALAAASSSLYWCGFLASRGLASLLLLRVQVMRVFFFSVAVSLAAACILMAFPSAAARGPAMFLVGAGLAPIYPLLLATFLARACKTSDLRFVLAASGLGGSVLPWLSGWISTNSGSLRLGLLTVPVTLLIMLCVLPVLSGKQPSGSAS
jgi:fucose permease